MKRNIILTLFLFMNVPVLLAASIDKDIEHFTKASNPYQALQVSEEVSKAELKEVLRVWYKNYPILKEVAQRGSVDKADSKHYELLSLITNAFDSISKEIRHKNREKNKIFEKYPVEIRQLYDSRNFMFEAQTMKDFFDFDKVFHLENLLWLENYFPQRLLEFTSIEPMQQKSMIEAVILEMEKEKRSIGLSLPLWILLTQEKYQAELFYEKLIEALQTKLHPHPQYENFLLNRLGFLISEADQKLASLKNEAGLALLEKLMFGLSSAGTATGIKAYHDLKRVFQLNSIDSISMLQIISKTSLNALESPEMLRKLNTVFAYDGSQGNDFRITKEVLIATTSAVLFRHAELLNAKNDEQYKKIALSYLKKPSVSSYWSTRTDQLKASVFYENNKKSMGLWIAKNKLVHFCRSLKF